LGLNFAWKGNGMDLKSMNIWRNVDGFDGFIENPLLWQNVLFGGYIYLTKWIFKRKQGQRGGTDQQSAQPNHTNVEANPPPSSDCGIAKGPARKQMD
jgi:hypothetical protein